MKITNNKPVRLEPVYHDKIAADFDITAIIKEVFTKPLYQPIVAGTPVTITANGSAIKEDQIAQLIIDCSQDVFNGMAEAQAKQLFSQALIHYNGNTNIGISELFPVQSGTAAGLQEPSDTVIYTPSVDVIPICRQFLGGTADYDTFFASLAYFARPTTLGFHFANEVAFDEFKNWLSNQMSTLGNAMPPETNKLMADFQNLQLKNLTESLILRNNNDENNDPNSFARLIIAMLMEYTNVVSNAEFGILPFCVSELIIPKSIVFVNVERHSRASSQAVKQEWDIINNSIQNKPQMIANSKLTKLTTTQRSLQKMASATFMKGNMLPTTQAAKIVFSQKRPTNVDMARLIKKILSKMAFTNKSMNVYKSVKSSYAKPNRRDPDDFNKPGKTTSTQYLPDIHVYADTSGSISEEDYEDAIRALIKMAKTLNIDLYFNSFSHCLSQTSKLHLKDKTERQIFARFQKIPKVSGGTDFEQIWHFINQSKKRTRELSIIITDFAYTAPSRYIKHPKNLYYIPCSTFSWDSITRYAEDFAKSMLHNDIKIRDHILF